MEESFELSGLSAQDFELALPIEQISSESSQEDEPPQKS